MSAKSEKRVVAVVSPKIVISAAEELNLKLANEEKLAALLAEDLTYRLQVLVKKSVKHASRCRRKNLQSDDLEHILEEFGEAPFLAAHEPEYGVVNYEGNALHFHVPKSIDLSELSLEEERPEMLFSSFSMEKYAILVDGKPTAKFLKKQPKVFQHKSRYYPGHWDLYLIHLTHGLGDEYEDERVAFFAKDFESNPHLNEILPQLRFIIQQCSMCSVAERQLRMLQMLRGLLLNPFVDVARLEDELIKMAQFSLRDTGPEMIPGKEGLESAVQERATSFYNLMFKHGSICQEKLISSLRDIHPKDGSMFSLLSCGEAFLPAVRKGKSILARVAFLRRNIHCLTELIIRDDEPAASMMLVEPVGVFPTSLASQTLLFFRKIHCKDFGDRIRRDSNGQPKSKKKRRTKNVHDWGYPRAINESVLKHFDHEKMSEPKVMRIAYGKPRSVNSPVKDRRFYSQKLPSFDSGMLFSGIRRFNMRSSSLFL